MRENDTTIFGAEIAQNVASWSHSFDFFFLNILFWNTPLRLFLRNQLFENSLWGVEFPGVESTLYFNQLHEYGAHFVNGVWLI